MLANLTIKVEKLSSSSDNNNDSTGNEDLSNLKLLFPLRTITTLEELEMKLKEETLYNNLVRILICNCIL